MSNMPVFTFATWRVKEGQLSALLEILPELIAASTSEEGNVVYQIYQSTTDANTVILFESYRDESALAEHRNSEHFKTLVVGEIVPLLEERQIIVTSQLYPPVL